MALYEANLGFTHPRVTRRFRLHGVYDLDADVVELLAPQIAKGWLRPLGPHEVREYERRAGIRSGGNGASGDDVAGAEARASSPSTPDEDPAAQDPAGQGDDGGRTGEAPTPPASTTTGQTPPSPATSREP